MNNIEPNEHPPYTRQVNQNRSDYIVPRRSDEERVKEYAELLAKQFAALPMGIFADLKAGNVTYRDVCVYCYLIVIQRDKANSYWTVDGMVLLTGIPRSCVKESLSRLAKAGHIQRERYGLRAFTACLTIVEHGKGKNGIRIKGKNPTQFLASQEDAPKKKRRVSKPKKRNPLGSEESSSQQIDSLSDEDFFAEFDAYSKPEKSLCPQSLKDYNHDRTWGRKPDYRRP